MPENNQKIITRFAPSPTGFMHVGGVRTALYAWLLAKKNNGTFILRIEDTDKEREVPGSIDHIKESLKWLNLDWDKGPGKEDSNSYIQSERLPIYKKYAQKLIEKGLAFTDPYSTEDLDSFRKEAEENKEPFLYRNHRPENPPIWDGSSPLRFKISEIKKYEWNDLVWGDLSAGQDALDDFIIIKSDGYPTYNFAHIVDDIEMGVTHVVRGQEFISSVPKFLALYEALGVNPPFFVTTPPIMATDGKKKLGKRDGAKDILEYRKEGYLPEAMINFLALLGWNPGDDREIFSIEELIEAFEVKGIQRSGARWNDQKLDWINKEHLKKLSKEYVSKEIQKKLLENTKTKDSEFAKNNEFISKIYPVIFDRINKWSDIDKLVEEGEIDYFINTPNYEIDKIVWKDSNKEDTKKYLNEVYKLLSDSSDFSSADNIKNIIFDYATKEGRGHVLWPLRFSLSGKEKSPDPFTLIYILGKEESLKRVFRAIEIL